jgi:hypothetical protein
VNPEIFRFTVRDDAVAAQISGYAAKQVKLTYQQHVGLPSSCFGETEYFVTKVEAIGGTAPAAGTTPAPAATAPATTAPAPTTAAPAATTPPTTP